MHGQMTGAQRASPDADGTICANSAKREARNATQPPSLSVPHARAVEQPHMDYVPVFADCEYYLIGYRHLSSQSPSYL